MKWSLQAGRAVENTLKMVGTVSSRELGTAAAPRIPDRRNLESRSSGAVDHHEHLQQLRTLILLLLLLLQPRQSQRAVAITMGGLVQ